MLCQLILDLKKKKNYLIFKYWLHFFLLILLLLQWLFETGCYAAHAGLKFTLEAKANPLPPPSDSQDVEEAAWVFFVLLSSKHTHAQTQSTSMP